MMILVDTMIAIPKSVLADLDDLVDRAIERLRFLDPALADALIGARASVAVEVRTLQTA